MIAFRIENVTYNTVRAHDRFRENPRVLMDLCESIFGVSNPDVKELANMQLTELTMGLDETVQEYCAKFDRLFTDSGNNSTSEGKSNVKNP